MLTLTLGGEEYFDESKMEFISSHVQSKEFQFEHTLKAVFEWEGITRRSFLDIKEYTKEEIWLYMKCMCLNGPLHDEYFSNEAVAFVTRYLFEVPTATTIQNDSTGARRKTTAESIYAVMFELGVPKECEEWNINRLFALLAVISSNRTPKKKMNKNELLRQNRVLNEQRRAAMKTKG